MTADAVPSVGGPTDSPPSGRRPAVSVVVPTYRRAGLLAVTLDSLDRLEHPPLEILVCTDDWSDGSDAVAARPGVTPLDTRRQGAAGHRNAGWMAAQGDVVAFIDDDCAASPGWLGALIEPFRDPDVVLVQGRTVPAATPSRRERSIDIPCEYGLYETCNIAYRRQALEDAGGFDESLAERFGPDIRIFGPPDPSDRGGVLSFAYRDLHPHDISQILDEYGVCVRAGHHCAKPLMRRLGVNATARASLALYNDESDVDRLADALAAAGAFFG